MNAHFSLNSDTVFLIIPSVDEAFHCPLLSNRIPLLAALRILWRSRTDAMSGYGCVSPCLSHAKNLVALSIRLEVWCWSPGGLLRTACLQFPLEPWRTLFYTLFWIGWLTRELSGSVFKSFLLPQCWASYVASEVSNQVLCLHRKHSYFLSYRPREPRFSYLHSK